MSFWYKKTEVKKVEWVETKVEDPKEVFNKYFRKLEEELCPLVFDSHVCIGPVAKRYWFLTDNGFRYSEKTFEQPTKEPMNTNPLRGSDLTMKLQAINWGIIEELKQRALSCHSSFVKSIDEANAIIADPSLVDDLIAQRNSDSNSDDSDTDGSGTDDSENIGEAIGSESRESEVEE